MRALGVVLLVVLSFGSALSLSAQDMVTVPSMMGLNVPQAAAELNRIGLRLGAQRAAGWSPDSGLVYNTISAQSVATGTAVAPGTAVDVSVLRSPNIALLYDASDLTVINLTDTPIDIADLTFGSVEGSPALLEPSHWAGTLGARECVQVWSAGRSSARDVDECSSVQGWQTTADPGEYFWNATNNVFAVMENGVKRAMCDTVRPGSQDQPLRCEIFIPGGGASSDATPYVYFAYTPEAFTLINKSPDKWMPTSQTTLFNYNPNVSVPGASVPIGDPALYGNPTIVADITQLAPGQCLLFTSGNPDAALPEPCDVIARLDVASTLAFWLADFEIDSAADDVRRQCPAAVADKATICIMPR